MSQINIAVSTQTGAAEGNLTKLESKIEALEAAMKDTGVASVKAARDAEGSFNQLEKELKQNEAALRKMALGSKEFDAQKVKVDGLRKSLAGAKGELKGVADQQGMIAQAGSSAIGDIKSMAMQFMTVQAVVQAISAELEHVSQLKLEAAGTKRTLEQSVADMALNLPNEDVGKAREMVVQNAPKLGATQEGLADLMATAMSGGAKNLSEALEVSAATLKSTAGDANKAKALLEGSLDITALSGSNNFQGAIGQMIQLQAQSPGSDMRVFATNVASGLAAATADGSNMKGMSTERAFEMTAVISNLLRDRTGANSATALRQFASKMDSFNPEKSKTLTDGSVVTLSDEQISKFKGANSFDERLAVVQQDKALQQQFLGGIEESIGKTAIREIVGKSERATGFEQSAAAGITGIDAATKDFQGKVEAINAETTLLTADRKHAAVIQKAEVTGGRAEAGQVEKMVQDTIDKMNLSGLDSETQGTVRNRLRIGAMQGANPLDTGITALEEAKQQRKIFGFIPGGGQVSEEDKRLADETIQILRDMKAAIERQNATPVPVKVAAPATRPAERPLPERTQP